MQDNMIIEEKTAIETTSITEYHKSIRNIYWLEREGFPFIVVERFAKIPGEEGEPTVFYEIGPPYRDEKAGREWRKINPDNTITKATAQDVSALSPEVQVAIYAYIDDLIKPTKPAEKTEVYRGKAGRQPQRVRPSGQFRPIKYKPATFPVSKIDRATGQDLLPMMMNKGIFTGYKDLPKYESILEKEKNRLQTNELTFQEKRAVLSKAKRYIHQGYVMTDYGEYSIGVKAAMYEEVLNSSEADLKKALSQPSIFPEDNMAIEKALKRIRLWKLAHRLSMLILSEAYQQKEFKHLSITKGTILQYLGYTPADRQIYQDIQDAMFSLKWCDYVYYNYEFTDHRKEPKRETGKATGVFLYNLIEDSKQYTISINEKFAGCVSMLYRPDKLPPRERKQFFERGYYNYPTRILPLTRDYSTTAYNLTNFLIMDNGNRHHAEPGYKVVVYSIDKFIKESGLRYARSRDGYGEFLIALEEVEIIEKTDPAVSVLRRTKPSEGINTQLKVWVKTPVRSLDTRIREILAQKKK